MEVEFSPQALMITEFRELWENDVHKDKYMASRELAYVFYMCDHRSDYMYILDEKERSKEVIKGVGLGEDWKPSIYVEAAMKIYVELSETTSTRLLNSTRGVVAKISHFLDTIDPNERDQRTNKPVFDINKITGAVEKIPKLIKALNEVEKEVIKEQALKAQSGNKSVGLFDDNGL